MSSLRRSARLLFLPLLLLLAACGGGGGGSSPSEPPPTPTPPGITFTPDGAPANSISLAAGAATTATTLVLEVRANSVTDLYGVAFDLHYPSAFLRFNRATIGAFLTGGTLQATPGATGVVIVGAAKLGPVSGATGSGVLMSLEFQATGPGQGTFSFARNSAIDSAERPPAGLTWSAGAVTVVQ